MRRYLSTFIFIVFLYIGNSQSTLDLPITSDTHQKLSLSLQRLNDQLQTFHTPYQNKTNLYKRVALTEQYLQQVSDQLKNYNNVLIGQQDKVAGDKNVVVGSFNTISGSNNFIFIQKYVGQANGDLLIGKWRIEIEKKKLILINASMAISYINEEENRKYLRYLTKNRGWSYGSTQSDNKYQVMKQSGMNGGDSSTQGSSIQYSQNKNIDSQSSFSTNYGSSTVGSSSYGSSSSSQYGSTGSYTPPLSTPSSSTPPLSTSSLSTNQYPADSNRYSKSYQSTNVNISPYSDNINNGNSKTQYFAPITSNTANLGTQQVYPSPNTYNSQQKPITTNSYATQPSNSYSFSNPLFSNNIYNSFSSPSNYKNTGFTGYQSKQGTTDTISSGYQQTNTGNLRTQRNIQNQAVNDKYTPSNQNSLSARYARGSSYSSPSTDVQRYPQQSSSSSNENSYSNSFFNLGSPIFNFATFRNYN